MASTDARPIPLKNTAFRVTFPILDADGDLVTGASGLDSEVSQDGGGFADCTNEATEIGSSGIYYLDLTSGEMNGDCVAVIVKTSTSGAKTVPMVFYPAEDGDVRVNVVQFGSAAGTFASGIPAVNAAQISGDATAADNLESYLDGTAYMPVDPHKVTFSVSGTTLTVKEPDGTTTAYTKTLTTDAGAEPITGAS